MSEANNGGRGDRSMAADVKDTADGNDEAAVGMGWARTGGWVVGVIRVIRVIRDSDTVGTGRARTGGEVARWRGEAARAVEWRGEACIRRGGDGTGPHGRVGGEVRQSGWARHS